MTIRRPLAVLLAAGLALAVAACSDDGGSEDGASSSSSSVATESTTTTTITDAQYEEVIGEALGALDEVGSDLCALSAINAPQPPAPANPQQTEQYISLYTAMYGSVAAAIEDDDPQSAEALRAGAAKLKEEAEAADYDATFASPENPPASLTTPEFTAALQSVTEQFTTQCQQQSGGDSPDTTVPESAPEG